MAPGSVPISLCGRTAPNLQSLMPGLRSTRDRRPDDASRWPAMRVLFAAAELAPVTSVGGLGEAVAGLVAELRATGVDVDVVLPDYAPRRVALAGEVRRRIAVPAWAAPASVRVGEHAVAGRLHLVSVPGIERSHPYLQPDGTGWPDNDARFLAFSRAVAAMVRADPPDVLHLHDWHTARRARRPAAAAADRADAAQRRLPGRHRRLVAAAARAARPPLRVVGRHQPAVGRHRPRRRRSSPCRRTTPPRSARRPAASGSTSRCATAATRVIGIRNGIDTARWDPATDRAARRRATTPTARRMPAARAPGPAGAARALRVARRRHAARRDGDPAHRPEGRRPRGARSCRCCATSRCASPCSAWATASLARTLAGLAADHPASFAFVEAFDEVLAHRLFAGGDVFVMPSRFEPCGLAAMQAMRYGAIPVVTPVGGLVDTVPDVDAGAGRPRLRRRRRRAASASCRRCSAPPGCSPTAVGTCRSCAGSWRSTGRGGIRRAAVRRRVPTRVRAGPRTVVPSLSVASAIDGR